MTDFVSEYWSWFIAVPVILGIIAMFWLNIWLQEKPRPKGEEAKGMGHIWDGIEELNNPLPSWWLNMFYATLVFTIGYLVLYPGLGSFAGLLGWTQKGQYEQELQSADEHFGPIYAQYLGRDANTLMGDAEAMRTGRRLFLTYCAICHSSDASGSLGFPNLRDQDWLFGGSPEQIKASIANGRYGVMPAWQNSLGEEKVFNVSEYVLSLSGRDVNAGRASMGKTVFAQSCAGCHGADGKGNTALGAPNLTDGIWLYGGSQKAVIDSISNGRGGRMPAHQDFLGDAKVHLLTTYVYSLSADKATGK